MSKVLVVVDYQKDFVDGALGFKKAEALEEGIYNKVKEYLDNGDKVVFTYDTHYDNYLETREGINLPVKHCIKGTEGHKLYGSKLNSINFNENTVHICKEVFGISPEDMIDLKNKLGNITDIEMVGIVTNMCVISNAVMAKAACPEAEIIIKKDLVDSFDKDLHQKALDVMASMQMTVE